MIRRAAVRRGSLSVRLRGNGEQNWGKAKLCHSQQVFQSSGTRVFDGIGIKRVEGIAIAGLADKFQGGSCHPAQDINLTER